MIPFIRSLSELRAITNSRLIKNENQMNTVVSSCSVDSGQRKRYLKSLESKELSLPDLPKSIKRKWTRKKVAVAKFINALDYNNQIQSSYDLTLLERQSQNHDRDVA